MSKPRSMLKNHDQVDQSCWNNPPWNNHDQAKQPSITKLFATSLIFFFWLTGISDFKQIGPVSFQSGLGLIHLSLRHLCHAYVLNCILCINLHFAVLIYNLFNFTKNMIPPFTWTHESVPPDVRGFMLAPKCVSINVEHIHFLPFLRQWLAVHRFPSAYLVGANGIGPTWAQLRVSYELLPT